jgi:hypothetical protein
MRLVKKPLSIHRIIDSVFYRVRTNDKDGRNTTGLYESELEDGTATLRVKVTGHVVKISVMGLISSEQLDEIKYRCRKLEEVSEYVHGYHDKYTVDLIVSVSNRLGEYFAGNKEAPPHLVKQFLGVVPPNFYD